VPTALEALAVEASTCVKCRLCEDRTTVVFGMGDPSADLMFIGEGPGEQEDRQGLPFVGRSGQLLDRLLLEELGITRDRVYIANVVKCRPPGNRDPKPDEIDACRPYLQQQLDLIRPTVVVTLGRFAAQWLLESTEGITRLRGRSYPFAHGVLIPTLHPAAALRGGADPLGQMRADFVRAKMALAAASAGQAGQERA
jgi:DNA polymerase